MDLQNTIPIDEAAARIIVCGVYEIPDILQSEDIGGIVSVCRSSEYLDENPNLIQMSKAKNIPHHQSLALEKHFGFSKAEIVEMPEEELIPFVRGEVEKTLQTLDDYLKQYPNKKVILHCRQGSDRSATMAIAYFLECQGENPDIDEAIRTLHRIRPHAILDKPYEHLYEYWGDKADEYIDAIKEFHASKMVLATISGLDRYSEGQKFRCLKHCFDDIADRSKNNNESGTRKYLRRVSSCNRFGIKMDTWYRTNVANPYIG